MAGFVVYVSNTTYERDGYLCYHDKSTEQSRLSEDKHFNCSERRQDVQYPSFYSKHAFNELCEVEVYIRRV